MASRRSSSRDLGMDPQTFLVVRKPYAERRTMATARRRWPASRHVAVTSEQISFDDYRDGDIPPTRVLSMLVGEVLRLESYAATGLIDLDEPVPDNLLDAAHALQAAGYDSRAVRQ